MMKPVLLFSFALQASLQASMPEKLPPMIEQTCVECHDKETAKGGLDLTALPFTLNKPANRDRWIRIHDRIDKGEMPPKAADLPGPQRTAMVRLLASAINEVDHAEVVAGGRGPMRRLNRDEYEQNLRDVLQLPGLDIRDMLPEDREGHRFNKTTETLDISRVQLTAYLDAAEAALRQAMAGGVKPPASSKVRVVGTKLFPAKTTFGNQEAMFFARDSKAIDSKLYESLGDDPSIEMALFRSAHWPYFGYPLGCTAKMTGEYRVRFSARSVLQQKNYVLASATRPVPMTFRARRPSGADVSGDVRATGGVMDIQPETAVYETTNQLRKGETFEYSLLGLPMPLARNVNNGPPSYRYPPFPEGGQPGVAFQWLEIDGPVAPCVWPPSSHHMLFDDLPIRAPQTKEGLPVEVVSLHPKEDVHRLLRRFVKLAAREPVPDEAVQKFEQLALSRLEHQMPFAEAMLAGYKAFLCSSHFLYLHEPTGEGDHFAIASRLSHFLTNTRPDALLMDLAPDSKLRDAATLKHETERLIAGAGFARFVKNFTDYWLNLRNVHRDEPDIRLYPEYRFDDYLVDSMEVETQTFFTAMIRDNLPATSLVEADFVFANDCLAIHYGLPAMSGSAMAGRP